MHRIERYGACFVIASGFNGGSIEDFIVTVDGAERWTATSTRILSVMKIDSGQLRQGDLHIEGATHIDQA